LLKTILKKYAMGLSKIAKHPKIRAVHLRNEHERQIFTAAPFDLPGTENTPAVSIDQDRSDEPGVIGMLTFYAVSVFNGGRIKLLEQLGKKIAIIAF
jgi:hypothetical protein